jgi:nitrous oxidase accessory protein NosD
VTWGPKQVIVDGARFDSTADSPDSLPANSFVWVSGQGLYVNLGGDNPGQHDTRVGRRSYGFSIFAKSWVTVDGFTITRTEDRGVYLQNACTNVVISNNHESLSGGYGFQGVGGSALTFEDNVAANNIGHGIALISGATGCMIRGNESYGNFDPATRVSNGIYCFSAPSNTICDNSWHNNQDTGIHLQTGSNDCVEFNNISFLNGDHGYDHLFATGTTHLNDVAYGNHMDGFSIEGSSSGVHLANCIAVDNGLTTNRFDLWIDGPSTTGFQSNYNIFWE